MSENSGTDAAEVLGPDDEARWRELLPVSESVFGSVEFARLQQRHAGVEPCLFALRDRETRIVYPFHLRSIGELPFAGRSGGLFDAATPQYTGPLASGKLDPATVSAFSEALSAWCDRSGVVTEFAHLHPWKARPELLDPTGLEPDREIVYVDLAQDHDRVWRESFSHAARKNVKRARREGVRVRAAAGDDHMRELHRLYELTMDRQGALASYYFPPEYFSSFGELLPDNSRVLIAEHEGRVVAATLYLYDDSDVYSYLGGSDHAAQRVRPTNAIVDEVIRWARSEGRKRLVLGGGYAPGDGIMRFKASFSPLRAELRLFRRVRMPQAYESLCEAWREHHGVDAATGFFPPYRAAASE
jgi:serine/alanine adding enzyme